jgi:heptosyltransferase-2
MIGHLVVRAPNWVGDLVMATPVIEAALADRRFERVTIAVRSHLAGVLHGGPADGRLLELCERASEAAALRAARADAVLLLSSSFSAAWRSFRAGIPLRAGSSAGGRGWLLTHRVVPPTRDGRRVPIPTAHVQRDVAGLLGILPPSLHPRLHLDDAVRADARAALERAGLGAGEPYVLCAPGAAFGAAKLWPPRHHAATLDALHARHGWRGVVTGAPGEEPTIAAVAAECRHPVVSLAAETRDLVRLKAWVEGTELLLVGDSGPRWYAAAFDVPCVTVMGPNSPELTASSLEHCEVLRLEDLECSPCLERVCPLGHHRCMRDLRPELAIEAAERVLAASP